MIRLFTISEVAFIGCSDFSNNVIIPDCNKKTSVKFENNLDTIDNNILDWCSSLNGDLIVSCNVIKICQFAFAKCIMSSVVFN